MKTPSGSLKYICISSAFDGSADLVSSIYGMIDRKISHAKETVTMKIDISLKYTGYINTIETCFLLLADDVLNNAQAIDNKLKYT